MRRYLAILPFFLLTSCGITTGTAPHKINAPTVAISSKALPIKKPVINTVSANILAKNCGVEEERFNVISSLRLSTLLQIDSAINSDINQDKLKDNVLLVGPTSALTRLCKDNGGNINADYKLIADISEHGNPIITDLGLKYVSGASLEATQNGFIFSNEIGQSIKCEEEAIFKIDDRDIYLDKVRTICLVPDSDIDWQERDLEKSAATLLQNVDLSSAFDGLREVFFK